MLPCAKVGDAPSKAAEQRTMNHEDLLTKQLLVSREAAGKCIPSISSWWLTKFDKVGGKVGRALRE